MAAVIRSAARSEYLNVQEPSGPAAIAAVRSRPVAAISAVIADRLLRRAAARLPLRLVYPDGKMIGADDATAPALLIHQPHRLARRIGRHGLIGFGEFASEAAS
jgi:cyclopropane-fatty-acyl-phospholipid synthase